MVEKRLLVNTEGSEDPAQVLVMCLTVPLITSILSATFLVNPGLASSRLVFTSGTLASAGISCCCVFVCPSV